MHFFLFLLNIIHEKCMRETTSAGKEFLRCVLGEIKWNLILLYVEMCESKNLLSNLGRKPRNLLQFLSFIMREILL